MAATTIAVASILLAALSSDGHYNLKPTDKCVRIISPQQRVYSKLTFSDGSSHYRYPQADRMYAEGGSQEGIFPAGTTLRIAGPESLIASNPVAIESCAQECTVTRVGRGWLHLKCGHPKCPTKKNSNKLKGKKSQPKF